MAFGFGRTTVASAKVVVDGDTRGMSDSLDKADHKFRGFASTSIGHGARIGSSFKTLGGAAVLGLGAAGVGGAILGLKAGFDDLAEGQAVAAQTAAVIKSTGNAAHVTAGHIGNLANSISAYSGQDDEAIQSGENLLLTFTNVRNEAGKGNDVFNQATKTMADLSQAFGQDTKSSAIQLGKALNDPVKGMTALSRVGVSFTAGQANTIKHLVKTNDVLGAQKLMLKVVNEQVAGSAEAYGNTLPGMIDRAKNAVVNFISGGLAQLQPYLVEGVHWVQKFAKTKEFQEWMDKARHAVKVFRQDFSIVFHALEPIARPILTLIGHEIKHIADIMADMARLIDAIIHGDWSAAWHQAKNLVSDAVSGVRQLLGDLAGLCRRAISAAASAAYAAALDLGSQIYHGILNGIGDIVGAVGDKLSGIGSAITSAVPGFASGTPYAPGGMAIVGENGPELMYVPKGATITPNQSIGAALRGLPRSGGGGGMVHVTIQSLHPSDAGTLAAVARAVNKGQDIVNSPGLYEPNINLGL